MKKRFVAIGLALMLVLSVFLVGCGPKTPADGGEETAAGPVILKLSHFLAPQHFYNVNVVEPFVKEVEELTEGRVKFDIFVSSSLGAPESQFDMAATGIADVSISLQSYTSGKFSVSSVVELPFISKSAVMGTEILKELYEKFPAIQDEYKEVKVLWLFQNDPEYLMMAKKEIHKLDDLAGLKMRTGTDVTSKAVDAWGGSSMFMPISDVYDAAQRGVIDGATGPLSVLESFRLADVFDSYTGGPFTIANFFVVMNKDAWNKLSSEDQAIIEGLIDKYRVLSAEEFDQTGVRALNNAVAGGDTYVQLSDEEQKKFEDALSGIYDTWVEQANAKGAPGEEILKEARRLSEEYIKANM